MNQDINQQEDPVDIHDGKKFDVIFESDAQSVTSRMRDQADSRCEPAVDGRHRSLQTRQRVQVRHAEGGARICRVPPQIQTFENPQAFETVQTF